MWYLPLCSSAVVWEKLTVSGRCGFFLFIFFKYLLVLCTPLQPFTLPHSKWAFVNNWRARPPLHSRTTPSDSARRDLSFPVPLLWTIGSSSATPFLPALLRWVQRWTNEILAPLLLPPLLFSFPLVPLAVSCHGAVKVPEVLFRCLEVLCVVSFSFLHLHRLV